jgi:hypothetical protein
VNANIARSIGMIFHDIHSAIAECRLTRTAVANLFARRLRRIQAPSWAFSSDHHDNVALFHRVVEGAYGRPDLIPRGS